MIKCQLKTILWWTCPNCGIQNQIEERFDRAVPDDLECKACDYIDEWMVEEEWNEMGNG